MLDEALGGGLPAGCVTLVEGEPGAGSSELAFGVLASVVRSGKAGKARVLSGLRSPERVSRELAALLGPKFGPAIQVVPVKSSLQAECLLACADMGPGDVLVVESASRLVEDAEGRAGVGAFLRRLGDVVEVSGALVVLLHTRKGLPTEAEALLAEAADAVLAFEWRAAGTARRRLLTVVHVRGLPPALEGEQVPVFEVSLRRGAGVEISRVKAVL